MTVQLMLLTLLAVMMGTPGIVSVVRWTSYDLRMGGSRLVQVGDGKGRYFSATCQYRTGKFSGMILNRGTGCRIFSQGFPELGQSS